MSCDIYAVRASADNSHLIKFVMQIPYKCVRQFAPAYRRFARSDDTDDMPFGGSHIALRIEQQGSIRALTKTVRIVIVLQCPDTNSVHLYPFQLALRTGHSVRHAGHIEMPPCFFCRAVMFDERQTPPQTITEEKGKGNIV